MGIKKMFIIGLAAVGLLWAASISALPIGELTVGPGDSWVASWTDTTNGKMVDKMEFFIMTVGYEFDQPVSTNWLNWSGYLVNPTYSFITGLAMSSDKTLNLYFAGTQPSGGVQVDMLVWYQGDFTPGESWRLTDLPNQGGWGYIDTLNLPNYSRTPVPEGGSIVVMLGVGIMTLVSLRRWW
jgi:hypothetical protein